MTDRRTLLIQLFSAGVDAVSGAAAVSRAMAADDQFAPDLIIAVGKAASGMCKGALSAISNPCKAIVVTKYQHADAELNDNPAVTVYETAHPIPDDNSLSAGRVLLQAVADLPKDAKLLLLVSGGASALAECLPDDMSLVQYQNLTQELLAGGKTIAEINKKRKSISLLKDGKLLQQFVGKEARVYAISDVQGDAIDTIGSGIGDDKCCAVLSSVAIVASNKIARDAVVSAVVERGLALKFNQESLYDDVFVLADRLSQQLLTAEAGVYIWGGEPTIHLPAQPGSGGRNQSLALALAERIAGTENITMLVAGTDGTDGPTDAAGAIINGKTCADVQGVELALKNADAGRYLRESGNILITGPTNTNVMDLVIAIVD